MEKKKFNFSEFLLQYALYFILLVILVVIVSINPKFLSLANIINILKQASTKGILALGVGGLIVLAGTDLSVGRILGLTAAIAASLLQSVTFAGRYYTNYETVTWGRVLLALLICIVIATLFSAFNGFGVAKLHMHPFIVTLGSSLIAYGLCCIYIENQPSGSTQALSSFDEKYLKLTTQSIKMGSVKIPWLVIIFLVLAAITWVMWNKTTFGKNMFAVGGNTEAAEVSGISVTKTIMTVYVYAGIMYGIGSFLEGARVQSVGTSTGFNYEQDAIASCVIGGVSFNGGIGTVQGIVIGSIILQAINYGLYFLGVNAYLQYVIRGAIIIIAVAIDVRKYINKR